MGFSGLNPFVRYASLHRNYARRREDSVCYDCRLFFILKGEGALRANGDSYAVSQNFAVYLPCGTHYRFEFKAASEIKIYVLNFDLTDAYSTLSQSLGTPSERNFDPQKVIALSVGEELDRIIVNVGSAELQNNVAACVENFMSKSAYYKHSASAHLKLALIELLKENKLEQSDYRLVQNVQEYIRRNYHRAELNNRTVASEFSYHPYHISRLMKRHTQKTLHEYIMNYRLDMAKNYLTTTALNVTEIAVRTGFSSYTYFIKLFRERIGISPLQYRRTQLPFG